MRCYIYNRAKQLQYGHDRIIYIYMYIILSCPYCNIYIHTLDGVNVHIHKISENRYNVYSVI